MICRERQEFFSDLYDGNLPADRRRDLESHLSSCPDCRAEYEHFTASLHALREAASAAPGDAFVRRVVDTARGETERQALFQNTGLRRPTTRRTVAPRRAAWAIPAVAAVALIAFSLGLLIQRQAKDREIRDLQDQIARGRPIEKRDPGPTKSLTNEELNALWRKEHNVVSVDGLWMSADLRDRLNRGEWKDGDRWVDAKKEIARQVAEKMAQLPDAPDPKAVEELVLEKNGLVRRGDWILPKAWADAFDQGQVLDGSGQPKDVAAIVNAKIAELKLVEHEGRWMRPEELAQIKAHERIHKGPGAPLTALTKALDGMEVGPPVAFRNLMLYPLTGSVEKAPPVATLAEALAADRVEIVDEGNALQVKVKNRGDADLALLAGDLLVGGRHGRVVARDVLVPARKDRTIDVFDAEPADLRAADKTAFKRDGGSGQMLAPLGMRRALNEDSGQAGVWSSLLYAGSRTSVADLHREHRPAIAEYRAALGDLRKAHPAMTGVAIAIGDSLAALELYGSPALFAGAFDRVVDSAALEAIVMNQRETRFPSDLPAGMLSVRRLAESAFAAEQDVEGDAIVLKRFDRVIGRALASNGEAVRVVLFPEAPPPARPALDLPVAAAKVQHVLNAYESRLQANGPRRAATLREIAMLPGAAVGKALLQHGLAGAPYRKEAIDAMGLRGDPALANQLLKWLEESRKDRAMYTALAQALVRLNSEDAIQTMIGHIDPRPPKEIAQIAGESAALLLSSARNVNVVEAAVGTLISALNRLPADSGAGPQDSWQMKTLRQVTGKSFAGTMDYAIWWNDAGNRRDFLELRKK